MGIRKQVEIKVPEVASIIVTGPTQCGKSIVMDRIKKALEAEFSATVISPDLDREKRLGSMDVIDDWEHEMVGQTIWHLVERN